MTEQMCQNCLQDGPLPVISRVIAPLIGGYKL